MFERHYHFTFVYRIAVRCGVRGYVAARRLGSTRSGLRSRGPILRRDPPCPVPSTRPMVPRLGAEIGEEPRYGACGKPQNASRFRAARRWPPKR